MIKITIFAAIVFSIGLSAARAGDVAEGLKVFVNRCGDCHVADIERNKVGPSLKGLFGRIAGSVAGYNYSDAMKASGITWGEDTLKPYLLNPKAIVPKNKMAFNGLKREGELENLIEYLKASTK